MRVRHAVLAVSVVLCACPSEPPKQAPPKPVEVLSVGFADGGGYAVRTYDKLLRIDFNQRAQELFLPLFWRADANNDKVLEPEELVVLWGPQGKRREDYVAGAAFTPAFEAAYEALRTLNDFSTLPPEEQKRREAVRQELLQGRPTLVETDLSQASAEDKALAGHLLAAAVAVEKLYARQNGTLELAARVPADDPLSRALFTRNQGPWCEAPKTQHDPACTAVPGGAPKRVSGLYPAALQADAKFCEKLEKEPNGKALAGDHFAAVVADGKGYKGVPYTEAWKDDMEAVASQLEAAAAAVTSKDEAALKAYLGAAATAFRTNDWEPANAAWVAMGPENSKWYVRVAPDEVYSEPCSWKANFALQLARINPDSLAWQKKLEPVKGELEKALAELAGAPYRARAVQFKLPDFIDVVLNAGDQRMPSGATIGQSLPNWGPVAEKGGRTVAMTNLYTDADSQKQLKVQLASLLCAGTMARSSTAPAPATMSTVLHEAAHNLGPAHDYAVKGKKDHQLFGGPLASMLEELKAQTSALYFADWLVGKKVIEPAMAEQAHVRDLAWAFGHISRGMYDGAGKPRPYSQLAAIQLGWLVKSGALTWKPQEKAANEADLGCFELDLGKPFAASVEALERRVLKAKATGDKADAEKLKAELVDADGEWKKLRDTITERWLQAPKATFVYGVRL